MKEEIINAKLPKMGASASVKISIPETIEEAVSLYGANAVLSNALANWRITLQGNIRAALARGMSAQEIQERLASAKMGVSMRGPKADPVQAFLAKFASATPEDQKRMLAELQARAKAK